MRGSEEEVWHQIARDVGMPVWKAKASMTSSEFVRWVAFYQLDRERGSDRMTVQLAIIAHQVYLARYMLGGTPDKGIQDFIFDFKEMEKQVAKAQQRQEGESALGRFAGITASAEMVKKEERLRREVKAKALSSLAKRTPKKPAVSKKKGK